MPKLALSRRFGECIQITDSQGNILWLYIHKGTGQQVALHFDAPACFTILRGELLKGGQA